MLRAQASNNCLRNKVKEAGDGCRLTVTAAGVAERLCTRLQMPFIFRTGSGGFRAGHCLRAKASRSASEAKRRRQDIGAPALKRCASVKARAVLPPKQSGGGRTSLLPDETGKRQPGEEGSTPSLSFFSFFHSPAVKSIDTEQGLKKRNP